MVLVSLIDTDPILYPSPQEFKCPECEFRALNQADVELHRRSMHRTGGANQPGGGVGGPYVIANPAMDTKPGRRRTNN